MSTRISAGVGYLPCFFTFIYMIPIGLKSTKFSLYLFVYFFETIILLSLHIQACASSISAKLTSQYAFRSKALFGPLHSILGKVSLQSIQPLRKIQKIHSWNARPISLRESHKVSISAMSNSLHSITSTEQLEKRFSLWVSHWSLLWGSPTANRHLRSSEESNGSTKGLKANTMMQAL